MCLKELEALSTAGTIDLLYADESGVCTEGYVPYGWQFAGERVSVPATKDSKRLNCFALINRENCCHSYSTTKKMDGAFIAERLEELSFSISKQTVVVLDCASTHRSKLIKERLPYWRKRGLWLFYLPPYSPHLNLAETLWRVMKGKWLKPEDYSSAEQLFYATAQCLKAVGKTAFINFSPFNLN
jgi:transposase